MNRFIGKLVVFSTCSFPKSLTFAMKNMLCELARVHENNFKTT